MWFLKFENSERKVHLLTDKVYTIGRKDADIMISDDSSVSRKHGSLQVINAENEYCVTLKDFKSKFGTFYSTNGDVINRLTNFSKVDQHVTLKENCLIRIGGQQTFCKLYREPLLVVMSRINKSSQESLKSIAGKLGGFVTNSWKPEVTYLAINEIQLNIKVISALASSIPIVKEEFFNNLLAVFSSGAPTPSIKDWLPPVSDEGLDKDSTLFLPDSSRKTLFKDRLFVFLTTKQLKQLSPACTSAGGRTVLISDIDSIKLNELICTSSTAFFLPTSSSKSSQVIQINQLSELQQQLTAKNLRFIQEHEIGLALIYRSIDVYTNPKFNLTSNNALTQQMIPESSLPQASEPDICRSRLSESQQPDTPFISDVPETLMIEEEPHIGKQNDKKRLYDDLQFDHGIEEAKNSSKCIKLEQDNFDENQPFYASAGNTPAKSKLPSKRKRTSDTAFASKVVKQSNTVPPTLVDTEFIPKKEFTDSCIADDSLWSCKTESQTLRDYPEFKESKSLSEKQRVNALLQNARDNARVSIKHIKTENVQEIPKKAFVPASIPDENAVDMAKLEDNLPFDGLSIVVQVPLVKQKTASRQNQTRPKRNVVKNFKTFIKVLPSYKHPGSQTNLQGPNAPRIIGGRDFKRHVNSIDRVHVDFDVSNTCNAFVHSTTHNDASQELDNPFANID